MAHYYIPFYKFQYFIYRCFIHLNLFKIYKPIYFNKESKNKDKILDFIINKRYTDGAENNKFFLSLVNFYKIKNNRIVDFDKLYNGEKIYQGNGFRLFNKQLLNNSLEPFYNKFLDEMNKGISIIKVSKKNYDKAVDTAKFLCIYPFVEIRRK